jgi:hypothetical protein
MGGVKFLSCVGSIFWNKRGLNYATTFWWKMIIKVFDSESKRRLFPDFESDVNANREDVITIGSSTFRVTDCVSLHDDRYFLIGYELYVKRIEE